LFCGTLASLTMSLVMPVSWVMNGGMVRPDFKQGGKPVD
jgi:hypothetical protein